MYTKNTEQQVTQHADVQPIISRKEAKAHGFGRYFTGKPCKHGHFSERYVSGGGCIECTTGEVRSFQKALKESEARQLAQIRFEEGWPRYRIAAPDLQKILSDMDAALDAMQFDSSVGWRTPAT